MARIDIDSFTDEQKKAYRIGLREGMDQALTKLMTLRWAERMTATRSDGRTRYHVFVKNIQTEGVHGSFVIETHLPCESSWQVYYTDLEGFCHEVASNARSLEKAKELAAIHYKLILRRLYKL